MLKWSRIPCRSSVVLMVNGYALGFIQFTVMGVCIAVRSRPLMWLEGLLCTWRCTVSDTLSASSPREPPTNWVSSPLWWLIKRQWYFVPGLCNQLNSHNPPQEPTLWKAVRDETCKEANEKMKNGGKKRKNGKIGRARKIEIENECPWRLWASGRCLWAEKRLMTKCSNTEKTKSYNNALKWNENQYTNLSWESEMSKLSRKHSLIIIEIHTSYCKNWSSILEIGIFLGSIRLGVTAYWSF